MAKFKTKAEQNFESRLQIALEFSDFDTVEKLFTRLGYFYELVDPRPWSRAHPEGMDFEFVPVSLEVGDWMPPTFTHESRASVYRAALAHDANDKKMAAWADVYEMQETV